MNAHTSGPWATNGSVVSARVGARQCYVCEVSTSAPSDGGTYRMDDHRPELMANARLIAAAPELLATLQEAVDRGPVGGDDWRTRAREVIAKATGEKP